MSDRVIVVGGGIGGLAAAIALLQIGLEVRVLEQASALNEVGAGITLWANATKVLRRLGLGEELARLSSPLDRSRLTSWRGRVLMETAPGALEARFGAPTVCIHRADLQGMLARALPDRALQLGLRVTGLTTGAGGVTVELADGRSESAAWAVGADGIRSVVRAALHGGEPPRYAGYVGWRAISPFPLPPGVAGMAIGRGSQFGMLDIGRGRSYWFATKNCPQGSTDPPEGKKVELERLFARWHEPIPQVIAATAEAAILRNDIIDRPPLERWGGPRVTLLGDAAHATTPNLGQGACMAIEDAAALALAVKARPGDVEAALWDYEEGRSERTARVTELSWRMGRIYQMSCPLGTWLRDLALRVVPVWLQLRQLDWLVGHEIEGCGP